MRRLTLPLLVLVSACTASAATERDVSARQQARLDKALAGLTPDAGAQQHCIEGIRTTELRPFADTILFVEGRKRIWRNDVTGSCPGLARGDVIVTRSASGRYCRGDTVETRARTGGQLTGVCSLGSFTRYTAAR